MSVFEEIEAALQTIRPALHLDGGDVQLVDVDEATGVVRVRMQGACRGCPMSSITLKMGMEALLTEQFPFVKEVIAVEEEPA